ncbi:Bug family tripartite tricarboxylate transporter substrate binding protein [Roseomonas sp. BN140053]|uniref:Bug family tripartite tricarboxylate transporter substrate binding protein n=1 Tax=Roseomonas sp. BN140053 TaxID=3391898 RepID=UPI0039E8AD37
MRDLTRRSFVAVAGVLAAPAIRAQNAYPDRTITMILPFAPGGPSDLVGRLVAQKLEVVLGRPVVVENRPGAGGTIASAYVARAAPDGYTLMFATSSTQAIAPALYRNLSYDPIRAFAPISQVSLSPLMMLANPSLPVTSVQELIAYGKANPGKLNYGSAGNGTPAHLSMVVFNRMVGIEAVHVPYRSGGEAVSAALQGQVQYLLDAAVSSSSHIQAGTLRALAVCSENRSKLFPQIPTVIESGVPGYTAVSWGGLVAPAGTPPAVVERLHQAVRQALVIPDLIASFARTDTIAVDSDPETFATTIAREAQTWRGVIAELRLALS